MFLEVRMRACGIYYSTSSAQSKFAAISLQAIPGSVDVHVVIVDSNGEQDLVNFLLHLLIDVKRLEGNSDAWP